MESIRIQADMIAVTPELVLSPGQLVVRQGRIAEVTGHCTATPDVVLADTALLAGLINCHAHLEFSDLGEPLPAGENFPTWIGSVVRHRRAQFVGLSDEDVLQQRRQALLTGLVESFSSGSVVLADIVSQPWSPMDLPSSQELLRQIAIFQQSKPPAPPQIEYLRTIAPADMCQHLGQCGALELIAFAELIGLTHERINATCNWAWDLHQRHHAFANNAGDRSGTLLRSIELSPHAPYSLQLGPVKALLERLPRQPMLAMHVAESREELQWIETGQGAFADSFRSLDLPTPESRVTIDSAIELLSGATHGLLIHGNYLTAAQIEHLAVEPGVSVVYCPRTHAHFGHAPHPLERLLAAGVRVVLGTDSRASSPSLSLVDDMREMLNQHSQITATAAWAASTSLAATALGLESDYGTLQVGRRACCLSFRTERTTTPENLFEQAIYHPARLSRLMLIDLLEPQ